MNYFIVLFIASAAVEAYAWEKVVNGVSGQGTTTHYWDCCKPSCAWRSEIKSGNPVQACAADGVSWIDESVLSGCIDGGWAYTCSNQQPWAVSDTLAYGFVAASFTGGVDTSQCCICLKLSFGGELSGKTMIVQNTNTGSDLGQNHFDIQIPGGGVGIFTKGCHDQWNAPWSGWGQQYDGVSSDSDCSQLPWALQPGCHFRFNWFQNAGMPPVYFEQVQCPYELTSISGCSA